VSIFGWLFGSSAPPRRRQRRTTSARRSRSAASRRDDRRELDRQAREWLAADNRKRRVLQAREERQRLREQRQRLRQQRIEVTLALRAERAHKRDLARLLKQGWTEDEAARLLDYHYEDNPTSCLELALRQLGLNMRSGRPAGATRRGWPTTTARHPVELSGRHNPQLGAATDPAALSESETFHGEGGARRSTATLSERERASLPRDVVVVGRLESVSYKPLRGSERSGAVFRGRAKGRSLLVADPHTGKVGIVGGPMRFKPDVGLYG
jgi:hypothetical protein